MGRFPTQTFSCESSQNVAENGKGVVMNSYQKRVSSPSDTETRLVDGCEQTCGSGNQIRALQEQQVPQPLTHLPNSEFHNYEVSLQASLSSPSKSNVLLRPVTGLQS